MSDNNNVADDTLVIVEEVTPEALAILNKSEIDQQISTAHAYPRSVEKFEQNLESMATKRLEVAEACMYSLPRGGKAIIGPSVRYAEILASTYTNIRAESRILKEESRFIVAQGVCHDLESNYAVRVECRRRITGNRGRYNEDMIATTGMAAQAIAFRNAVFKVIPRALWDPTFQQVLKIVAGDAKTLEARLGVLMEYFKDLGVKQEQVYRALGVEGFRDMTVNSILTMRGYANALKAGEIKLHHVFPDEAQIEAAAAPKTLDEVVDQGIDPRNPGDV